MPRIPLLPAPCPRPSAGHCLIVVLGLLRAVLPHRARLLLRDDAGMTTAEYAVGTLAAAALAAVLYVVVTNGEVAHALGALVKRALNVDF